MLNKVVLMGRCTADPELMVTAKGISVTTFTVAVNRRFKNASGEYEADFINCVAWRNTAEFIAKYFGKGKLIAVIGSIQTRKYQDKNGNNRVATEVVVDEAHFCGENKAEGTKDGKDFEEVADDIELPF